MVVCPIVNAVVVEGERVGPRRDAAAVPGHRDVHVGCSGLDDRQIHVHVGATLTRPAKVLREEPPHAGNPLVVALGVGGHVVLFGSVAGDGDVLGGELRVVEGLGGGRS